MNIIRFAAAKLKLLNMRTSMTGVFLRHSQKTSEIRQTAATHRQRDDEMRTEPVVFLALVEQDLKRAHAQRQQRDADVIDANAGALGARQDMADLPPYVAPGTGSGCRPAG